MPATKKTPAKTKTKTKRTCSRGTCSAPADYMGHVDAMTTSPQRREAWARDPERHRLFTRRAERRPYCKRHYLQGMFGLWPYTCPKRCNKDLAPSLSDEERCTVWLSIVAVVARRQPRCPWCGSRLKQGSYQNSSGISKM